jgi:hypothetical protein
MGAKLYKNVAMNYYFIFKTQKVVGDHLAT